MTTHSNSFRLHRLVTNLDSRKKSITTLDSHGSETLQLAALNSINKSVKYNNLSFTTGNQMNKLRKQPQQPSNIQQESAHFNLLSVRKKFDSANKTKLQRERSVDKLNTERQTFLQKQNQFLENKNQGKNKQKYLEQDLNEIKQKLQSATTERKVLECMIARFKSDKIVYDNRKYQKEKELQTIEKQKKIISKVNKGIQEENDRTKKVQQKLFKQVCKEQDQRDIHVNSVEGMKSEKMSVLMGNQEREKFIVEIAEEALQQKDSSQKKWYKVYLCHRLVERLLRDKMTKEMMKFNVVETAFKNIKTSTGVNNSETLISKYLNKESTYGEYLGKIAENEKMITELKAENDALNKETKILLDEEEILSSNKIQNKDLQHEIKILSEFSDKKMTSDLYQKKMQIWVSRVMKKFNVMGLKHQPKEKQASNKNNEEQEAEKEEQNKSNKGQQTVNDKKIENNLSGNKSEIIECFKKYFQNLKNSLDEAEKMQVQDNKIEFIKQKKNCRLKFKNMEKMQSPQVFFEEDVPNSTDDDDCLNDQRLQILRNNEKFMREMKRKTEELKKAKIEAQPKKKEVVIEKPKQNQTEA